MTFSSAGSIRPRGRRADLRVDFGDGTTSTAANPTKTYTTNGTYTADADGHATRRAHRHGERARSTVGNTAPTVTVTAPADGQLFTFGDTVPFSITVTDPEDGTIDCTRVKVTYVLGHDSHGHQITSQTGCTGSITIPVDGEHDAAANIFGVFDAEYTDNGAA